MQSRGSCVGTSMFDNAMSHFSGNYDIDGVTGFWLHPDSYDDGISANYDAFWNYYNGTAKTTEDAIEAAIEAALNTANESEVLFAPGINQEVISIEPRYIPDFETALEEIGVSIANEIEDFELQDQLYYEITIQIGN